MLQQWFITFPELAELSEFLFHLGKTSLAQSGRAQSRTQEVPRSISTEDSFSGEFILFLRLYCQQKNF